MATDRAGTGVEGGDGAAPDRAGTDGAGTVSSSVVPADGADGANGADDPAPLRRGSRRAAVGTLVRRLITAIREGDDEMVENAVLALSARNRLLAPLALAVGAFAMLFQGIKLLFTNWRLTLIQVLPAMWIWLAMFDIKAHLLHDRQFHVLRGPVLIPLFLVVMGMTVASFYLNGVFAFAIAKPGEPETKPAYAEARAHLRTIVAWGSVIGFALAFSGLVVTRWGLGWFTLSFGIVTGVLMLAYVALPARLVGLRSEMSRRDKLTASAVGGVIGALVCSPPYFLGRLGLIMFGSSILRIPAVIVIAIAVVLQTGATSAIKAVKMSAKIVAGRAPVDGPPDSSPSLAEPGVAG